MYQPDVSVIMSVYNGEAFLREAIESILNQTLNNFEFIIIDDGSTDRSISIIESFNDCRIIILKQDNMGLSYALNKGIKYSRAKYIARMDADDISLPERLEMQYKFLETNANVGLIGTWIYTININGEILKQKKEPITNSEISKKMLIYNCFNHGSVMFRKSIYELTSGYSIEYPENPPCEDYALWLKMLNFSNGFNLPKYLYKLRIHANSVSKKYSEAQRQQHFFVAENHLLKMLRDGSINNSSSALIHFSLGELNYHNGRYKESRKYFIKPIFFSPVYYHKAIRHLLFSYLFKKNS